MYVHTVLYSGKDESVVIESSMVQETHSEPEDRAEHSPLLTEEDTSADETKTLSLKTTTQPQVYNYTCTYTCMYCIQYACV